MNLLDDSEVQDFHSALIRAGYDKDDFELTEAEDESETSPLYADKGKAIVRRISTSVIREYRAGHASRWVSDFNSELLDGKYGPA